MLSTALKFSKLGFWVIAIHAPGEKLREKLATGKEPIGRAWGRDRWTEEQLRAALEGHAGRGIGICFGPGRGPGGKWLIDLEGDGEKAEESLGLLLGGEMIGTASWASTRGAHAVFFADGERLLKALAKAGAKESKGEGKSGVWKLPGLPDLEFRIGGYKADGSIKQVQSVVPPTPGTNGRRRTWTVSPRAGVATLPEAAYTFLEGMAQPEPDREPLPASSSQPRTSNGRHGVPDVESRAVKYLEKCDPAISGQGGHNKTFGVACKIGPGFDLAPDVAFRLIRDHYNARCEPPWSDAELRHKIEDAYRVETHRGWLLEAGQNGSAGKPSRKPPSDNRTAPPPEDADEAQAANDDDRPPHLTDLGNAKRLVAIHGRRLRFCHPWGKWLTWRGDRWKIDDTGISSRWARDTVLTMYAESIQQNDKRLRKWAVDSESRDRLSAMLTVARSEEDIPVLPDDLNADPWLLNVRNGTIDLRNGELREHRPEDLLTSMAPVDFNRDATCPVWERIQGRIFGESTGLIRFWKQLCGLSLTGDVKEQILPILYGTGANGKSTVVGTLLELLGQDYSIAAPPGLLIVRKGDTHPTERATLYGKRLVVDMESAEGARLNENFVKQLTGSDRISARRMREDFWDFAPTHKIMLITNHKPEIKETKNAIWRRIKLIPFTVTIPEEEQIKDLPQQLRMEYSGILRWCIEGCLSWQKDGLLVPEEVTAATDEYRGEQDTFADFISDECIIGPQIRVKASMLYERYRRFTERSGESSLTQKSFGMAMTERKFERYTDNGTYYRGIGLREEVKPIPKDDRIPPY